VRGSRVGRLLNLPFALVSRAAKAVATREDQALKERHGEGDASPTYDHLAGLPDVATPPGFDPGSVEIRADRALSAIRGGEPTEVVDVRDAPSFRSGHARGAVHMPLRELGIRLSELSPDARLVVYGDSEEAARRGVLFLRDRGLEDAWVLVGGLDAWRRAGGEVER
jgi:queuine tRNA-ribosyltransferase